MRKTKVKKKRKKGSEAKERRQNAKSRFIGTCEKRPRRREDRLACSLSRPPHLRVVGDGAALGVQEGQRGVHFGVHGRFLSRARGLGARKRNQGIGGGSEREEWVDSRLELSLYLLCLSILSSKPNSRVNAPKKMASDDERRVQMQLQQELQVAYMQEFYSVRFARL